MTVNGVKNVCGWARRDFCNIGMLLRQLWGGKNQVCSSQRSERENAAGMYHSQEVRQVTGGSTAVG